MAAVELAHWRQLNWLYSLDPGAAGFLATDGSDGGVERDHRHRLLMRLNPGRKGVDSWLNRRTLRRRMDQVRVDYSLTLIELKAHN